jgi:hypothetical protein
VANVYCHFKGVTNGKYLNFLCFSTLSAPNRALWAMAVAISRRQAQMKDTTSPLAIYDIFGILRSFVLSDSTLFSAKGKKTLLRI